MGFLSPWFLLGALAAAVPFYVHLLRQHRSDPLRFSSTMFLERRVQSSVKHRRLKYLALFSLRLLVILLLALMFANPFIRRSGAAGANGRKLLIIAVDNSYSMKAGDRLSQARAEAEKLIDSMRPGDRGQLVSFASNVQLLTQPTDDKEELRRALRPGVQGDGRSSYGEVSRMLRTLGRPAGMTTEAHIITDMQRSSMPVPFSELAVPPAVRLQLHAVAAKDEPNWFVENVQAPRSVFQPKSVRVRATVAGVGTPGAEIPVELVMNGKAVESRRIKLGESGRTLVEFQLPDAAYGLNRGEVRLTANDGLQADNVFLFALERREAAKILLIHGPRSAASATYYGSALAAVPEAGYSLETLSVDQAANVSPDRYAAVVLADPGQLPAGLEENLTNYVRRGGGVLVALGSSSVGTSKVPITGDAIRQTRYATREGERFFGASNVDGSHSAIGRAGSLDAVRFFQIVQFEQGTGRVLARVAGVPLLTDKRVGEGRVLTLASGLDNISNDLPLHPVFVPLVEQTAHYLSGTQSAPALHAVDSFLELRQARDSAAAVDVLGPDGRRALPLNEAAKAQTFRVTREGFYELRRANGRNELIAVHADRRESDLQRIPDETLALWQGTGASNPTNASGGAGDDDAPKPWPLWWYVCLALLFASLIESLFASRYLRASEAEIAQVRRQAA